MIERRWYVPAVLALLACGGLMFFAGSRTWASGRVRADGLPSDLVTVTGTDVHPLVTALSLVVAAAGLAVLATRFRFRQAVGVLTVVAAAICVVVVLIGGDAIDRTFADAVTQSTAFTGDNTPEPHQTAWPWVVVVAGLSAALLGALTVVSASVWPTMGGRYDAPAARAKAEPAAPVDLQDASGSELWKALDEGHDPTA